MTSKIIKNLVLAIMCKNEEKRIKVTLDSVKDYINTFFIFDTGSTDNTVQIIRDYCSLNNITLHLKQGTFIDFSTSRNELLQLVDDTLKEKLFVLMLDTNDEMQEMDNLKNLLDNYTGNCIGFHMRQRWWTGKALDTYFNVRMIKSHCDWRYKCVVHEYIMCPALEQTKNEKDILHRIENVFIYQDRTLDDDKSSKRFFRDKEMLYNEYVKNPSEPRTLFYLAQTASCLGQLQESYMYYLLRIKEKGFYEEIYQAYYRLGEISQSLGHSWEESMTWLMKAYQHSQRAEPLVLIAEHYTKNNLSNENIPEYHTAYIFASMACKLVWPQNQILFVSRKHYTYTRWHILADVCRYIGRYEEGKKACIIAIEAENKDEDKEILKFYMEKELEMMHELPNGGTSLISVTVGSKEIRLHQEFENKHDSKKYIKEYAQEAIIKLSKSGKNLLQEKISEFLITNGIVLENGSSDSELSNSFIKLYNNTIPNNLSSMDVEQKDNKHNARVNRLKNKLMNRK